MSKKILKVGTFGLIGGKKKKDTSAADAEAASKNLPTPIISALSPEETRRRKLLRGKAPVGAGNTILGSNSNLSGTLGG
jgi:hypothetical protein